MSHSRGDHPHTAQKPEHGEEAAPNVVLEWTSRVHFKKHELGGGFAVLIFLGEVVEDPEQWRTSRSFVGAHHAYVSAASLYGGGQALAGAVSEGFVQLNAAIAERSGLSSYEPDEVVPYLKDNLDWRIQAVRHGNRYCLSFAAHD
jgi:tyrosinase